MKTCFYAAAHALLATTLMFAAALAMADDAPDAAGDPPAAWEETLIVEASRLQQTRSELGSAVSVISGAELEALGYDFVVDALAALPAVTINQNGTYGGAASVRIRGAGSEQTLVLIDGVVVNDPSSPGGGFDFARIDPAQVDRIEVLKGPQSTLWGSDAIGGVVSITTRRATPSCGGLDGDCTATPLAGSVFGEYGAHDTARAGVNLSGAGARGDYALSATRIDAGGISKADEDAGNREDDGYESTSVQVRGGLNLGDARLDVSVSHTDAEAEFDAFVFGAPGNVGDGDEVSETEELTAQVSLRVPALDGRLDNQFLVGYREIERDNFSNGAFSFGADGERRLYRYQGTYTLTRANSLAIGIEREDNESSAGDSEIDSVFALYQHDVLDNLTLSLGLRRDDIDGVANETTGRAALSWRLNEQVTLRGSWAEGFKAPSIFQTTFFCCGAAAPNADLAPEESRGWDVGVAWQGLEGRAHAELTWFEQDTDNLITFSFLAGGYENIARAESQGVELAAGWRFTDWLGVDVALARIDATDTFGEPLIRVPEHTADVRFSVDPQGPASFNVVYRYNDDEADFGQTLDSWSRVDISGRYAFSERLEAYARIENLFDEDYQQIIGYGTPGTSLSAGVRLRF